MNITTTEEKTFRGTKDGFDIVITRSYQRLDNGEPLYGRWAVYKVHTGEILDYGVFRHDLMAEWFD